MVLVVLAPFALSIVPVRRYVAQRLSDEVGREVTIGGITARWWSGIELRDVRVANPAGYPADPLLTISRLHADVAVLRLLRGRVEAAVRCEKPVVSLALPTRDVARFVQLEGSVAPGRVVTTIWLARK